MGTITGTSGNDTITGTINDDIIYGGSGDDLLHGGSAVLDDREKDDDIFYGGLGNDTIFGHNGADTIFSGSSGHKIIDGGIGDDVIYIEESARSTLYLNNGFGESIFLSYNSLTNVLFNFNDYNTTKYSPYFVLNGNSIDYTIRKGIVDYARGSFYGHGDAATIHLDTFTFKYQAILRKWVDPSEYVPVTYLSDLNDNSTDVGSSEKSIIVGGLGHDRITAGSGADMVYGNTDCDTLIGGEGNDSLFGGQNDTSLDRVDQDGVVAYHLGRPDQLYGGAGDDLLYGNFGSDVLYGEDGSDNLFGGKGQDSLHGGNGADILRGNLGNDYLSGGDGADTLYGGAGDDTIAGNFQDIIVLREDEPGVDRIIVNGNVQIQVTPDATTGSVTVLHNSEGWIWFDNRLGAMLEGEVGSQVELIGVRTLERFDTGWIAI